MHVCDLGPFPMTISWNIQEGEYGFPAIFTFIGKPPPRIGDHQVQWEFIRRYMDEGGLQAVALPRISSKYPWPWKGLTALAEGHEDFFKTANGLMILGALLLSPAFLVIAFIHWISLLLCWTPHWPKALREAGQPGKPVPKLTTLDDYPPLIAAQLKENAHLWKALPGRKSKPETESR
jgi:hypothetical protein